jgi:hypothetical protein
VVREAGQILTQLTAVMFKQLLQAGSIDVCQIDACRLGGVNEVMAVLLMAKKFGIPVVPHSGGVGLVCPFPCSNAPGRSHANQVSLFIDRIHPTALHNRLRRCQREAQPTRVHRQRREQRGESDAD